MLPHAPDRVASRGDDTTPDPGQDGGSTLSFGTLTAYARDRSLHRKETYMPIHDLDEAQTDAKYAKAFRKDVKKAKTSNVPFMVFDKFKFKSGMNPMVLLGKYDPKDDTDSAFIDKIKERGVYKAEGLCKFDDEELVFQIKKGRCSSKILQGACDAIGDDITWRLKKKVNIYALSKQVGTSIKYIETTYSKAVSTDFLQEICKGEIQVAPDMPNQIGELRKLT